MLTLTSRSAIRRAKQKPRQWGPLSAVRSAVYYNAERLGIDPASIVGLWPFWEGGGNPTDVIQGISTYNTGNLWTGAGIDTYPYHTKNTGTLGEYQSDRFTCFCSFRLQSLNTASSGAIVSAGGTGTAGSWSIGQYSAGTNDIFGHFETLGGAAINLFTGVTPLNRVTTVVLRNDGATFYTHIDGVTKQGASGNIYKGAWGLSFGVWGTDPDRWTDSTISMFCYLNKCYGESVVSSITEQPYALIQPVARPFVLDLGAGQALSGSQPSAWRVLAAQQQATAWRLLEAMQRATDWAVLTADAQDGAWRILGASDLATGWRVLVDATADAAWAVEALGTADTAWQILKAGQAAQDTAWHIETAQTREAAWRIATEAARQSAWALLTRADAATAWQILAAGMGSQALAWRVLTEAARDAGWRVLDAGALDTAWADLTAGARAAAWDVLTQASGVTGWRILAAGAGATAWTVLTVDDAATSWAILRAAQAQPTEWQVFTAEDLPTAWQVLSDQVPPAVRVFLARRREMLFNAKTRTFVFLARTLTTH